MWLETASAGGFRPALLALAAMDAGGLGGPVDRERARRYLEEAVRSDDADQ
jgi:TPR repeat protein